MDEELRQGERRERGEREMKLEKKTASFQFLIPGFCFLLTTSFR
jgi:hypothetical protein